MIALVLLETQEPWHEFRNSEAHAPWGLRRQVRRLPPAGFCSEGTDSPPNASSKYENLQPRGKGDEWGLWMESDYEETVGPRGIPTRST